MEERVINNLFAKARNEGPETALSEVQKWIGFTGVFVLLGGLAFKFKTLFTSNIILMTSSIIVASSIAIGAIFYSTNTNKVTPTQKEVQLIQQDLARETTLSPIQDDLTDKAVANQRAIPLAKTNEKEESSLEYILPLLPFAPIQRGLDTVKHEKITAKAQDYGSFDAIKVSGVVDVVLIQGANSGVRIEADEAGQRVVRIRNEKGTLKIYTESNGKKDNNFSLVVYVTFKELNKIDCSGASDIKSEGEMKLDNLFLLTSGASDIQLTLKVGDLKIESSGASDIHLNGSANSMELLHSGASELKAKTLEVKEADLNCSGASETEVYVTDKLKIEASGASDIKYKGSPKVEKEVSGVSSIQHL